MKFQFAFPETAIRELVDAGQRAARQGVQDATEQAVPVLRQLVESDFDTKATGGIGAAGIRWDRNQPETVRRKGSAVVGIESGAMRDSLQVSRVGEAVDIRFTAPHGQHFDARRQLLPDTLPPEWETEVTRRVTPAIEKPIQDAIQ